METIRTYLENLFAQLPETPELVRLRDDMLRTMEDKYEALKSEGKSENEAVGIVISEFGNKLGNVMGYVPQSVYLTDDTIRNNVAFGIESKEIDDEKVWEALKQAQLKDFVAGLERGLDTFVGDRGVRFSGGQRQRIAIARALYENPDIIIFDEATAALDNETETAVMESIRSLQGYKTTIIIAHRLTTIKDCDVIYEIKDGKAVVRKYEELLHE